MATTDGIITPDYPGTNSNVPTAMLTMAESLRGRTVRNFASTSARDTAMFALPTAARQGALVYVQGQGWQGYNKASDPYDGTATSWWSFDRAKGGRIDYTGAEPSNNCYRVPSSACWFDGQQPTAITAVWCASIAGPYVPTFYTFDGGGALFRIYDPSNVQTTGPAALMWTAIR